VVPTIAFRRRALQVAVHLPTLAGKSLEVLPNNFSFYFQYLSVASIKTALFINRLGLIFLNQPPISLEAVQKLTH